MDEITTQPEYLPPLNEKEALVFQETMNVLLGQISSHETKLSHSYARLGARLREAELQRYYMSLGYNKFSHYLLDIGKKIGRERSQMYAILSVATDLLPALTEEALEEIGISKAHELRRLIKQGGSLNAIAASCTVGTELVDEISITDYAALDSVTAKQLRVKVNEILHIKEEPQGLWFDVGGFYATTEEREEIKRFWELGRIAVEMETEESEYSWKKQVFLAAARESISTWSVGNG